MGFKEWWHAAKNPDSEEGKAYWENHKQRQEELRKQMREDVEKAGGWSGIFGAFVKDVQTATKDWEEKNHPERIEWRGKLLNFVSNPNTLDDLTDDELETYKIIAQSELKRFEEAADVISKTGKDKGYFDGSESVPLLFSGSISWNEIHILTTLVERNQKLIDLINARQERRKKHPKQPDKKEQREKREEDLYKKLADLKTRRERLIKIETGGKPIEEWTEEEHRKVKRWEISIEAEEERIREELTRIWESV